MKIKKFNESNKTYVPSNDEEMINYIDDIIQYYVSLRSVQYYPDEVEINPNSRVEAAKNILKGLKSLGIDFDILYNAKKYNL